jgi:site-specific DNA-methyltransferase (adenine-specific)
MEESIVIAASWSIEQADAVTWLRGRAPQSADLVVTDSAYESLEKHRKIGTTTRLKHSAASSNDWFEIFPNARFPELFAELFRVLKKNTHCYFFCDQETAFVAKPIAEAAGFKFWKALIWDKGPSLGMGYHYRAQHELVLFFEKGKRKLHDLGISDVLRFPPVRGPRRNEKNPRADYYPTEKPEGIAKVLIAQSTEPGALVLDPFMGAGSTGCAAVDLGRSFAGCDIAASAVKNAEARLTLRGISAMERHTA